MGGISELLGEMIQVVQFVSLFSSPAESCLTFCNPMNCSMLGLPVHHQLLEFTQIMAIEWVMPSPYLILCNPFLLLPSIFPSIKVFSNESAFTSSGQSIGVSASASVLPMNIQDGFNLLAVQGTLKSLLQHHSSKASILQCSAFFIVQLTSVHDYWKNHSFD